MKSAELFTSPEDCLRQMVHRLLGEVTPADDRRREQRVPYFCTTVLSWDHDCVRMPAYVRDISEQGIGFFHSTPIDLGELTATFMLNEAEPSLRSEDIIRLRAKICWCRKCGDLWHISGGELIGVVDDDVPY